VMVYCGARLAAVVLLLVTGKVNQVKDGNMMLPTLPCTPCNPGCPVKPVMP